MTKRISEKQKRDPRRRGGRPKGSKNKVKKQGVLSSKIFWVRLPPAHAELVEAEGKPSEVIRHILNDAVESKWFLAQRED